MKLWYVPLEPLDRRYTIMMDQQIRRTLEAQRVEFEAVEGELLTDKIEQGAFLDSEGTNFYKASQIQKIAKAFREGRVSNGDKFFISDFWFPGIEAIPYMAMFRKIEVELWGIMHAGSWTDTDFVGALKDWARFVELGWFGLSKGIFVGSEFHKQDILSKGRCTEPDKIHVTGLVFDTEDIIGRIKGGIQKRDLVVMAGRLDDEKQPWVFDQLAGYFPDVEFVKTYEKNLSKDDYFQLLSEAKVIFSAALQENFGYAVLEAATLKVTPVVPDSLAYREMWPKECRYSTFDEAVKLVMKYLKEPLDVSKVPETYNRSFERMLEVML